MKKFLLLVILLGTLFLSACNQADQLQQQDMSKVIDSLACGDKIDWFGVKQSGLRSPYLLNRLEDLRDRHEASMVIAGKEYTMTVLVSDDVPYAKYLLTQTKPPVDYSLFVTVNAFHVSPLEDLQKYLTIEKVCE